MGRFIKYSVMTMIVIVLAVISFASPKYVIHVIATEGVAVEDALGRNTLNRVDHDASSAYNTVFIQSKLYASAYHTFIPTANEFKKTDGIRAFNGILRWMGDRIDMLFVVLFLMFERLSLMMLWLPSTAVILIASAVTGFYLRTIKQGNFAFASPTAHRLSIRILIIAASLTPFFLCLPIPVSPYVYPVCFLIAAFMVQGIIANIAKRI